MAVNNDVTSVQVLADGVLSEIRSVLGTINEDSVRRLVDAILEANRIVVYGAGRMGMISAAFGMRLAHLGFHSHVLGEPTTPAIGEGDVLILSSGSGETQSVYDVAVLGKKAGVRLALITARPDSRIGRLADLIVQFSAPTKLGTALEQSSIQPMATLAEQSLLIFLDIVVLMLMRATHQTSEDLWKRHCNLE
ncbi:SIS domain-containing protein [Candidatus Poribacteria bacterium]|nr:SIS domain-containing protein [Candidatus Poribacteria bacterium]